MPQINVNISLDNTFYIKDPTSSTLGKTILQNTIELLAIYGLEDFNFKKLSKACNSTEASMYRYFENKHQLLGYLTAWFWDYVHFVILLETKHVTDAREKVSKMIYALVNIASIAVPPVFINIQKLHTIIAENLYKVNHTKKVDQLNNDGYYKNMKKIVQTIANHLVQIDPTCSYPRSIATNLLELSMNHEYYLEHLPKLTDSNQVLDNKSAKVETIKFIEYLIDRLLTYPNFQKGA